MKNKSSFGKMASWAALALVAFTMPAAFAATTNVNVGGATFTFNPAIITIHVGDTIVWTNQGGFHTVTGTGAEPMCGSGTLAGSCSHTFLNAGSFAYQCNFHVFFGMTGLVNVASSASVPPVVSIAGPADDAVFSAPADVTIIANATDASHAVTNVQFFANSTSLGSTNAPGPLFSLRAAGLAAGAYALTTVAADDGGLSATSPPVNISVVTPVAVSNSFPKVANGLFTFQYSANPGLNYVVQNSSNFVNWTPVITNTATSDSVSVTDSFIVGGLRFYRVGRLPNPSN
jgi:plastocyanin